MPKKRIKDGIRSAAFTTIGPACGNVIILVSLIALLGAPNGWMRLCDIGAGRAEIAVADIAKGAMTIAEGDPMYEEYAFTFSLWGQVFNNVAWLVIALFCTKSLGTIFGQSAGGKMISTLLIMEKARGLFQRAIMVSGGIQCIRDKKTAAAITDIFMKDAGLTKETAGELLTMPAERFVECQTALFAGLNLHTVGPVFDGINFAEDNALDIIRKGEASNVPVIIGTNRDEMELFSSLYKFYDLSEEMAVRLFGKNAPIVLRSYQRLNPQSETFHTDFVELMTEYIYRSGNLDTAKALANGGTPVYYFRNDYDKQPLTANPV